MLLNSQNKCHLIKMWFWVQFARLVEHLGTEVHEGMWFLFCHDFDFYYQNELDLIKNLAEFHFAQYFGIVGKV